LKKKFLVMGIILAVVTAVAVPMAVMAANPGTGTSDVDGTLGTDYTITVPGTITLPALSTTGDVESTPADTIIATTNDDLMDHVTISVVGTHSTEPGQLHDGATYLSPALKIKSAGDISAWMTAQDLSSAASSGSLALVTLSFTADDITIIQPQLTGSPVAGTYTETIQFTATFTDDE